MRKPLSSNNCAAAAIGAKFTRTGSASSLCGGTGNEAPDNGWFNPFNVRKDFPHGPTDDAVPPLPGIADVDALAGRISILLGVRRAGGLGGAGQFVRAGAHHAL